jgi:hypothetical protein
MRLNVSAFALTSALLWGVGLFAFTWWVIVLDGASGEPTLIGRLYRGYSLSPAGSVIGVLWALPDGLLFGAIFACLHNSLSGDRPGRSDA